MSKQEFVDALRTSLSGKISAAQVNEHVNYYEDYINTQIRMGSSEEEVLSNLGEPRLIAKSILTCQDARGDNSEGNYDSEYAYGSGYDYNDSFYGQDRNKKFAQHFESIISSRWKRTLVGIGIIVILFTILSLIFSLLAYLAPIIIPILVLLFLVKLFRDWLN